MIAKGDIRRVQEWMGHADIQTTMKYLHCAPNPEDACLVNEVGVAVMGDHRRATNKLGRPRCRPLCRARIGKLDLAALDKGSRARSGGRWLTPVVRHRVATVGP